MFSKAKIIELKKYGKVTHDWNRIIVCVKERLVYKYNNKVLPCEGLEDKDIYFIFDGIYFPANTCISGKNAHLIFRNCTFTQTIKVERAKYIEMSNNKYYFFGPEGNYVDLTANEIKINEDNLTNAYFAKDFDERPVNMSLIGEIIKLSSSTICSEYGGHINIMADYLSLHDSSIRGPYVNLTADDITTKNSVIKTTDGITIDNKNCNFNCAIKSPITIYNGIKLNSSNSEIINIDDEKAELLEYRVLLIQTLHKMEMNCIKENSAILSQIQGKLKNRSVAKVLKK